MIFLGAVSTRVISGKFSETQGPAKNFVPVLSLQTTIKESGKRWIAQVPSNFNGFIYVLSGSVKIGSTESAAKTGDVVLLPPSNPKAADGDLDELVIVSQSADVHFVLFAGKPLNEPVFSRGPFVMDSQEALQTAFRDYQRGEKYFIH